MKNPREDRQLPDGGDGVVTYSRVRARRPARPPAAERPSSPRADERVEPVFTATRIDEDDRWPADDLRATPDEDFDPALREPSPARRRKSRAGRFLLFAAAVAVVLGAGVLAVSYSVVTSETKPGKAASEAAGPIRLDPAGDTEASASGGVRTIPLDGESAVPAPAAAEVAVPAEPAEPPVPRTRPDRAIAAPSELAPSEPAPADAAPVASESAPAEAEPLSTAVARPTIASDPAAPDGAASGDDAFLAKIEKTLANNRAASSAVAPAASSAVAPAAGEGLPAGDAAAVAPADPLGSAIDSSAADDGFPMDGGPVDQPIGQGTLIIDDNGGFAGAPIDAPSDGGFPIPPADIPNAGTN